MNYDWIQASIGLRIIPYVLIHMVHSFNLFILSNCFSMVRAVVDLGSIAGTTGREVEIQPGCEVRDQNMFKWSLIWNSIRRKPKKTWREPEQLCADSNQKSSANRGHSLAH